jgi:hypothetical protein
MRQAMRTTLIAALLVALPVVATAETFTITLDNGMSFTTRYQPKMEQPDETRVMFLTDMGNWIAFPADRVTGVTSSTESRGFGRVIDTTTIALGFAPNEVDPTEVGTASDPTTALLQYLTNRESAQQRDYSVAQFVDTESAGAGGFPSNYGSSFSNSGNPQGFPEPGSVIVPPPAPPQGDGVQ